MGRAIAVRSDHTSGAVRHFARPAKDSAQARRLLAIAVVLDGHGGQRQRRSAAWTVRCCVTG
jgi:hypothetical protein